jgi:D-sedoheptulose 7-phosphate isomerase
MANFYDSEFDEHLAVASASRAALRESFDSILSACEQSIRNGGKLLFFGNGGSAADAQHLATELTIRYRRDRAPIAAIALTTDTSALTAAGNDLGFDRIFARQVEALGRPGDVAIGITTSGKSANVLAAFETCKRIGITTIAFTGGTGGSAVSLADISLVVPSSTTARIQEMHITLGQMLCGGLEIRLGLVSP